MAKPKAPKRFAFLKANLAKITPPKSGRSYVYDTRVSGLCLCTTTAGTQTFYSYKKVEGRPVRVRLGRYPDLTILQARALAADVTIDIARGGDPQKKKQAAREEMTAGDLFARWMEYSQAHKKMWKEDQRKIDRHLSGWRSRRLSAITKQNVQSLHTRLGKESGKYLANRVLELVRSMFVMAIDDLGFSGPNPAVGVKKFREASRDRYLLPDELPRFFRAVLAYPDETLRDFFLTALLTGARRGNVQAMCWADVDLKAGVWRIPETKSGEPVLVHLSEAALSVLQARRKATNGCPWVFPSRSAIGHLQEPKRAWKTILKNADITDLRIHDLRRTLGSWQAITGSSLPVIGKSLGHKSQSATAVYARLGIEPVRESVDRATAAILTTAGVSVTEDDEPPR